MCLIMRGIFVRRLFISRRLVLMGLVGRGLVSRGLVSRGLVGGLLVVILLLSVRVARAQSYFTHHLNVPFLYNGSYLAKLSGPEVALLTRTQWLGYRSTYDSRGNFPNSQHLTFMYPIERRPVALGLGITRTAAGPLQQLHIQVMGSYKLLLNRQSALSFSLTPALLRNQRDLSLYRADDLEDPALTSIEALQHFTLQAGTAFFHKSLTVGLSVNDLLSINSTSSLPDALQITPPLAVHVLASYDFVLSLDQTASARRGGGFRRGRRATRGGPAAISLADVPSSLVLTPTLFATYRQNAFVFNFGGQAAYNRVWGGILYRYEESLALSGGIKILPKKNLRIGYSLELVLHSTRAKQVTSHEIYLAYGLKTLKRQPRVPISSPRFYF